MPICRNCGVEIDRGLGRCSLCGVPLVTQAGEAGEAPATPEPGRIYGEASAPLTRRRLWEIVSLLAGTGAMVVLAADFANGLSLTWSSIPVVSIIFLWAVGSLLLLLQRKRLALLAAETAATAAFLLSLDLLLSGEPWFLTLALPTIVLAGALTAAVSALLRALRPRVLAMLSAALMGAALFVVGLETVIRLYGGGTIRLSWSLVVFGCTVPLVGLLFYIQFRLKITGDEVKKIFHV